MTYPSRGSSLSSLCFSPLQVESWNFLLCILYFPQATKPYDDVLSKNTQLLSEVSALATRTWNSPAFCLSSLDSIFISPLQVSSHHGCCSGRWRYGGHTVLAPSDFTLCPVLTPHGTWPVPQLSSVSQLSLLSFPLLPLVPMLITQVWAMLCLHLLLF